jgi:hypothetical protein
MKIKNYEDFTVRTAHILMCDSLSDIEKLNCIRLIYRELAFPEVSRTQQENDLLERIEKKD